MKAQLNSRLFNAALSAALLGLLFTSCSKEEDLQSSLMIKSDQAEAVTGAQARLSHEDLDNRRGDHATMSDAQERLGGKEDLKAGFGIQSQSNDIARQRPGTILDASTEMVRGNNDQERLGGKEDAKAGSGIQSQSNGIARLSNSSSSAGDLKGLDGKSLKTNDRCFIQSDEINRNANSGRQLDFTPAKSGAVAPVTHN